jgi:hypothetical protein
MNIGNYSNDGTFAWTMKADGNTILADRAQAKDDAAKLTAALPRLQRGYVRVKKPQLPETEEQRYANTLNGQIDLIDEVNAHMDLRAKRHKFPDWKRVPQIVPSRMEEEEEDRVRGGRATGKNGGRYGGGIGSRRGAHLVTEDDADDDLETIVGSKLPTRSTGYLLGFLKRKAIGKQVELYAKKNCKFAEHSDTGEGDKDKQGIGRTSMLDGEDKLGEPEAPAHLLEFLRKNARHKQMRLNMKERMVASESEMTRELDCGVTHEGEKGTGGLIAPYYGKRLREIAITPFGPSHVDPNDISDPLALPEGMLEDRDNPEAAYGFHV